MGHINYCTPGVFGALRTVPVQTLTVHLVWIRAGESACCKDVSPLHSAAPDSDFGQTYNFGMLEPKGPASPSCPRLQAGHRQGRRQGRTQPQAPLAAMEGHADGFSLKHPSLRAALVHFLGDVRGSGAALEHPARLQPRSLQPGTGTGIQAPVGDPTGVPKCLSGLIQPRRHLTAPSSKDRGCVSVARRLSCPIEGSREGAEGMRLPMLDLLLGAQERASTGCPTLGCEHGLTYSPS